jgi:hypothetical protein
MASDAGRPRLTLTLTRAEAGALLSAAEAATRGNAIDQLGWTEAKKAAYRRARQLLNGAMRALT